MKKIASALICLSAIWQTVSAHGVFQLKLLSFVNDEGLDQTGRCCTDPESSHCPSPCRTLFRVCLTHFQSKVDESLGCTFGRNQTPVLGENSFNFSESEHLDDNLIKIPFTFRWPISFSIIIDVLHESSRNENQSQDRFVSRYTALTNSLSKYIKTVDCNLKLGTFCCALPPNLYLFYFHGTGTTVISKLVKSSQILPVKKGQDTWTVIEPYVHRRSKLTYEYRVVCGPNQYGNDCATFCRPRNDKFGHYTCDNRGGRVCLPGWSTEEGDTYCMKAICDGGCHSQRGTCEEPQKCKCHVGWTGSDCSQCKTRPNCVHGTCEQPFECTCSPGWGGSFCNQDLNYCVNNKPCRNGGACSNSGEGSYTCNCTKGFIGKNCQLEVNECDPNPCQNGAECVDLKGGFKCRCSPQYSGATCQKPNIVCKDDSCQNGGSCMEDESGDRCICPPHWTGSRCDVLVDQCPDGRCHNNGSCRVSKSGFDCSCPIGFVGKQCETAISKCADFLCLNRGRCVEVVAEGGPCNCHRCHCPAPFSGRRCELNVVGDSKGHAGVVILKKSTFKSEHYVENLTETRVINLNQPTRKQLNASQWLGICLGSAVLVLLLLAFAVCLVYRRRRKMKRSKARKSFENSLEEADVTRSSDASVIAVHTASKQVIIRERNFQDTSHSEARLSRASFQQQAAEKAGLADVDRYVQSKMRPSRKSTIAMKDGHCCRRFSGHFVQSVPDSVSRDVEETIPLRRPSSESFPLSTHAAIARTSGCRQSRLHERPRSLRYSSSHPPTYEEVCREKDELVKIRLQSSDGIAI